MALLQLGTGVDLSSYKVTVARYEGQFTNETCQISGGGLLGSNVYIVLFFVSFPKYLITI